MNVIAKAIREFQYIRRMVRTLRRITSVKLDGPTLVPDMLERVAREKPNNIAILFEDRSITYSEFDRAANRVAHWALKQGVRKGDVVALLMENRPEYLIAWAGIAKIGAVTALINTNQTGQPLSHSLKVSGAKHLILDRELMGNFKELPPLAEAPMTVWVTGGPEAGMEDLDSALAAASDSQLPADTRFGMTARDNIFYIYTSGTTGNPKAANFSHFRFLQMANAFSATTNARARDRMYVVLPLYHTAGGVCATGAVLTVGGAVVLRRKFSASHFWADVRKYRVTLFQYIGELCRYLLNAPVSPDEAGHTIRLVVGNGLRPEIWQPFKDRFKIPVIAEFYGATEGNVALVNTDGKLGAIGRVPSYLDKVFNVKIVKFDIENETHLRNADGLCIECEPGEVGEALGRISDDPKKPLGRFEGYKGADDTSKKILRDVMEKGDGWFRTGDLLRKDREGYFYFVDRIGDTFRWKGENVATSEVAEVMSVFPGVKEANVFGVRIPGADGRAGMAAIVADDSLDMAGLTAHLDKNLPVYARPIFLRFRPEIEITGTFKHRKVDYVREGFDPGVVVDRIMFRDPEQGIYVPLTSDLYARIMAGGVRL